MSEIKHHFTVTCYILEEDKVLLLQHPKFHKWMPPGGHLEENELPTDGIKREVWEETGLEIELITDDPLQIDRPNAQSFARPFLCVLEQVPPQGTQPAHEHMDLIYRARPIGGRLKEGVRWMSVEEVMALIPDVEIFADSLQILTHLFEESAKKV